MGALRNAKHEHFAQLVSNGESATRAYVLAGYSEGGAKQSAARLLTNADVCARIADLRAAKEQKHAETVARVFDEAGINKAWVLQKLVQVVNLGMAAEPVTDDEGNETGEVKTANLNAANKALELIGKERGMFVDRKEVRSGPLDDIPRDDLKALRDALSRRLDHSPIPNQGGASRRLQ